MSPIALATERMVDMIARLADGEPDDREIPFGRLLTEMAGDLGVSLRLDPEEIVTAGELRRRTREARRMLALGEGPAFSS